MPTIKGTASIASSSAQNKLLRSTQFPSSFSQQVDVSKVNAAVITLWVEKEIERILGFEDEIVASMAVNLFFPKVKTDDMNAPDTYAPVDPRNAQLDLAGFLGEDEAAKFASELWDMMLDAQTQPRGIPKKLIEQKKAEIAAQKAAAAKSGRAPGGSSLAAEAARRANAARQALGYGQQQNRSQNRNWQHRSRNNQPRPVSPQHSVQHRQDPIERSSRYEREERRNRSRSRSRNRHEKRGDKYSDESDDDSYGRRRRRESRHKRDREFDDDDSERGRRSRKHDSRHRRSRSNERSRTSSSRNYRDERERTSDRKSRGRSRRERDYSRSRSRSSHRERSSSESSRDSRDSRRSHSSR